MLCEVPKRVSHYGFGMLGQRFASVDHVVSIDLDFQDFLLCFFGTWTPGLRVSLLRLVQVAKATGVVLRVRWVGVLTLS
jgi:hypothetical protein